MDIQYISNQKAKIQNVECSTIDSPKSFDTFDINIIDLNSSEIWRNKNDNTRRINEINDFKNLNDMIKHSVKCKIIIVIPQNLVFLYDYFDKNKYIDKTITFTGYFHELNEMDTYKLYGEIK